MQSALEKWQEARIMQIYFSTAFDGIKDHGSVGILGSLLSILAQFLLN